MTSVRPPFLVRHADIIFSLKTFAAAVLALLIALWADLPKPYWAFATVYIASQPLAGATRSKALFRCLGTVIGAIATVVLVPNLVNAPELLSFAIALWVGLCLYLSLLDRTPRSYMFMLAGYTAAFIGFPSVSDPGSIFDVAVSRSEEILLGIICASLVSTIVLPRGVGDAVASQVNTWLVKAQQLSQKVLAGEDADKATRTQRLQLAADAVDIDTLSDNLAYDPMVAPAVILWMRALRLRMLMLLPLLASIADRLEALGPDVRTKHPQLMTIVDDLAHWLNASDTEREPREQMRAAISAQQPALHANSSWDEIIIANLLIRLRELVDISYDCRALNNALTSGRPPNTELAFRPECGAAAVRHVDHGMALWSGAGAVLAVSLCCAFWIASGWVDGTFAPMMAAVACSFFATQDDPTVGMRGFFKLSAVSIIVAGVYLFAILPPISKIEMLIVALAPAFLLFGYLAARPATYFTGLLLAVNSSSIMALQSTYSADFEGFVNSSIAFLIGTQIAIVTITLARSVGAEWSVRRLIRKSRTEVARAAEQRGNRDRAAFAGLTINRVGLLVPRLALLPDKGVKAAEGLRELRVGLNVVDLRRARRGLPPHALAAMDAMLDELAQDFRKRDGGDMPPELLTRIDRALAEVMNDAGDDVRSDALIGLVGIRRNLFPKASPYRPEAPGCAKRSVAA